MLKALAMLDGSPAREHRALNGCISRRESAAIHEPPGSQTSPEGSASRRPTERAPTAARRRSGAAGRTPSAGGHLGSGYEAIQAVSSGVGSHPQVPSGWRPHIAVW
jgi:hypothetical protein